MQRCKDVGPGGRIDYGRARLFFLFQAEDGIRDLTVTGVQTCALPIFIQRATVGIDQRVDDAQTKRGERKQIANRSLDGLPPGWDQASANIDGTKREPAHSNRAPGESYRKGQIKAKADDRDSARKANNTRIDPVSTCELNRGDN